MTIEEIRKNAPDGATYYHKNIFGVSYFKRGSSGELFMRYVDGVWIPSFIATHKPKPL